MEGPNLDGRTPKNTIQLLAALDEGYLPQLQTLLFSIYLNDPGERFALYLLHRAIPQEKLAELDRWCAGLGVALHPVRVEDELFREAPVSRRYPKEMYYRLLAPVLLPQSVERALYLDPDILVINPLRPLWELDLEGRLFAAAAHTGKTKPAGGVNRLRLGTDHDYYNSGVLLMDLSAGRSEIVPQDIFRYTKAHKETLVLPDQDVLNALYGDRTLPLEDVVWNYDVRNYNSYLLESAGERDVAWVMAHTAILHFCGRAKPWKPGYHYRFGLLYQHYLQLVRRRGALGGTSEEYRASSGGIEAPREEAENHAGDR